MTHFSLISTSARQLHLEQSHHVSGDRVWGLVLRRSKCQDVCGLCSSCAESGREANCGDLSSPAASIAVASSDGCRKLGDALSSHLSDRHAIYAAGGWSVGLYWGMHVINMHTDVHMHTRYVVLRQWGWTEAFKGKLVTHFLTTGSVHINHQKVIFAWMVAISIRQNVDSSLEFFTLNIIVCT